MDVLEATSCKAPCCHPRIWKTSTSIARLPAITWGASLELSTELSLKLSVSISNMAVLRTVNSMNHHHSSLELTFCCYSDSGCFADDGDVMVMIHGEVCDDGNDTADEIEE